MEIGGGRQCLEKNNCCTQLQKEQERQSGKLQASKPHFGLCENLWASLIGFWADEGESGGWEPRVNHAWPTSVPCDEMAGHEDEGAAVNITYLNFRNAFDAVSHSIFVSKMGCYGHDEWTIRWMKNWPYHQAQRVVVNGSPDLSGD